MTAMGDLPEVVSPDEWLDARRELLEQEKELTRARDRVNAARRRLPMVRIEKPYAFEGPEGTVDLIDLLEDHTTLVAVSRAHTQPSRRTGSGWGGSSPVLVVRHRLQLRLPRHPRRPGRAGPPALPHGGRACDGRATPLGLQVGGPAKRLPDEYGA